jgi:hypothetical protein
MGTWSTESAELIFFSSPVAIALIDVIGKGEYTSAAGKCLTLFVSLFIAASTVVRLPPSSLLPPFFLNSPPCASTGPWRRGMDLHWCVYAFLLPLLRSS